MIHMEDPTPEVPTEPIEGPAEEGEDDMTEPSETV